VARLDRYIARHVLVAMLLVLLVLGGLDLLFTAVDELGETEGNYGTAQALRYVLFTAPRHLYELLPVTALIGALAGLGVLAAANELVSMQAAGMSRARIARAVMQPSLLVVLLGLVLGEYVVPPLEVEAEVGRSVAQGETVGLSRYGHWQRDGGAFLHFNSMEADGSLNDVTLFEFDQQHRLMRQVAAEHAQYINGAAPFWRLLRGNELVFSYASNDVSRAQSQFAQQDVQLDIDPQLLRVLIVDPDSMSIRDLDRFATRFVAQQQDASPYQMAYWKKLLQPLSTAVLVLLAISFIFGPLRSASMGSRVFSAICVGLLFTILQRLAQNVSQVYHLPPLWAVLVPILLCLLCGLLLLQRRA
jgi:lipopolysaccharide export system permease protein